MDDSECVQPLPLLEDGDYISKIQGILDKRGRSKVIIAKLKGHATDEMVEDGRVRWQDKGGHEAADGAVDYGRRR